MKKLLFLLTLTAAGLIAAPRITLADDQTTTPPKSGGFHHGEHMSPAERLKMMTEKLGLTQDQQDKIKAIFEKDAPAFKEIMSKGRDNLTEEDKTKLKDLMKSQHEAIMAVLTPDQQAKFKEMRDAHGPGGHHRKPDASAPAGDAPAK